MIIDIYTDGACTNSGAGKQSPGGWGYIYVKDGEIIDEVAGFSPDTTNNRMEMMAAIQGIKGLLSLNLKSYSGVTVYSDSAYLVNCFNQDWILGWIKNGWKNSKKKEVKNKDLWMELYVLQTKMNLTYKHVNGHSDNEFNNRADVIAQYAKKKQSEVIPNSIEHE